jgi:hypothetical protein
MTSRLNIFARPLARFTPPRHIFHQRRFIWRWLIRALAVTGARWSSARRADSSFVTDDLLQRIGDVEITMGQRRIAGLYRAYAQAAPGELVALVGSSGRLEISIVNGNAAQILGLGPDAPLILRKRQGIDSKLQEA